MKIWKASLSLIPSRDKNSEDRFETYFRVRECEEDYKYIEERKEFFYSEGWFNNRVPSVMSEEFGTYDIVKIVQGFNIELTEEEKNEVEMQMKVFMIEVLRAREEEYLSNLDKQLGILEEAIKYRYKVTGIANDGKKFMGECVADTYLDTVSDLFNLKGFKVLEIQSREVANANSDIKIEEIIVQDEI